MYNEIITFYSTKPPNRGVMENYTIKRTQENLSCGDDIEVFLKIKDNKILDFSFDGDLSIISTACASIFGESIIGMEISEVLNKKYSYIEVLIGMEISPRRKNAAVLGMLVTINAIHDYIGDGIYKDFDDLIE